LATGGLGGSAAKGALGWRAWVAVAVAVATLAVGSSVAADAWVRPALVQPEDAPLWLERFVGAAAEAIGPQAGLSILEIEGAVAGVVLVALLGAAVAIVRGLDRLNPLDGAGPIAGGPGLVRLGAVALAVAFVVSRKTNGGAALMPAAMMTFVVVGSGLWLSAGAPVGWRRAVHLCVVAAGLWALGQAIAAAPSHPFVTTCAVTGGLALLGALAFLGRVAPRPADSESPGST
jgi:hypothetical protein